MRLISARYRFAIDTHIGNAAAILLKAEAQLIFRRQDPMKFHLINQRRRVYGRQRWPHV